MTIPTPTDQFQARYGQELDLPAVIWNETIGTILSHRSVRGYLGDPLPAGALETMIAAAQSASTSSNLQTWSVVAVEHPETKARLAELAGNQAHIRQAPLFLVWLADLARLTDAADARGLPRAGIDYTEMFVMATIDAALAAQNAAVAAESLGLGLVYIGGMRNHPEDVAAALGLPPRTVAVFGMCVGYPDPARPTAVKPRLPQAAVLHRERYETDQAAPIATYNGAMARYYTEQQMKVRGDWVDHSANRVATPQSLSGRHRLLEALRNLGFELR